jgi:hypothetical protein
MIANMTGERSDGERIGGRGGSRTHGTVARTPDFESGALNHSATLPHEMKALAKLGRRSVADLNRDVTDRR